MPPPNLQQAKHWCFTLNNYTDAHVESLTLLGSNAITKYIVFGRETGESGTPHLQGFISFFNRQRFNSVRTLIPGAHLEVARGKPHEASTYCKKEGNWTEFGECPSGQGKRNDITKCLEWLDQFIADNHRAPSDEETIHAYPEALFKWSNFTAIAQLRAGTPTLVEGQPRPWQQDLEDILSVDCDDTRSVHFYVDERGNAGKSWFQGYMQTKYPTRVQLLQAGKLDDMAYIIDPNKDIFLFNITRGGMEKFAMCFSILEKLKDRLVQSPKYQSRMKYLMKTPHVVVFTNEDPPRDLLSTDRYKVNNLYNP